MAWGGTPVAAAGAIPMMAANGTTPVNTATNYRQGLLGALLAPAPGGPMAWRAGVVPTTVPASATVNGDLQVAQTTTASSSVTVAAGNCVIPRSGASGGPYVVNFPTTSTLVGDPASSSNPRIDIVCVQLIDAALGDSGTQGGALIIVNGTPASTPTVPAAPTGSITLAQLYRAANVNTIATANITDTRRATCVYGVPRPLLPGDLLTDAGSYIGEARSRYSTAYGAVLRDVWGVDGAWHGTQQLTGLAQSYQGGTGNITLTGTPTSNSIIQVAVADPGWAYTLSVSASVAGHPTSTWTAGTPPWGIATVYLDSVPSSGPGYAQDQAAAFLAGTATAPFICVIPEFTTPVLTGAHTVILALMGLGAGGAANVYYADFVGNAGRTSTLDWLNVTVNPA